MDGKTGPGAITGTKLPQQRWRKRQQMGGVRGDRRRDQLVAMAALRIETSRIRRGKHGCTASSRGC